MKTKWSYRSVFSDRANGSLFQKMLVGSIIVALLAAFLPASSVFAAPASDSVNGGTLEQEWSNKLSMVRAENLFYAQAKLFPSDFEDADDMARAYELLGKYGLALKQANAVIVEHAGFDKTGDVINEIKATESVQELGMYLHIMRGMLLKMDEEGYKIHRTR
jgi:hypothetical protein